MAVTGVNALRGRGLIVGVGYRGPNPEGKVICPFGVALRRGRGQHPHRRDAACVRYLAAQDSGRVMNELTFENQTQGGITMGLGLALTEERILDRKQTGKMVNRNWHDYKVPTAMDVPAEQVVLPIDLHDYGGELDRREGARRAGDGSGGAGRRQRHLPRVRRADSRHAREPAAAAEPAGRVEEEGMTHAAGIHLRSCHQRR